MSSFHIFIKASSLNVKSFILLSISVSNLPSFRDEIEDLKDKAVKIEEELKILLLPHDPNDDKNIILEIRAGTGGDEAALFASDLYRLYSRYAERSKWQYQVME